MVDGPIHGDDKTMLRLTIYLDRVTADWIASKSPLKMHAGVTVDLRVDGHTCTHEPGAAAIWQLISLLSHYALDKEKKADRRRNGAGA